MVNAALHLVGTVVALIVVMLMSGIIDSYFSQKRLERTLETASVKLDLPRGGVFSGEYNAQVARYLAERYDADRLANRVSDVGRPALLALEWLSYSVQLAVVVMAGWFAFANDPAYAASAWLALPIALALWALNVVASGLLYVLTGRVPGEARDARALSVRLRNEDDLSPISASSGLGKADASPSRS